jgi:hypothetical protein
VTAEHPAAYTERRECANANPHDAHEWTWDGATMLCAGRSAAQGRDTVTVEIPGSPFCPECGQAATFAGHDKSGHTFYGRWLSFRDFEQILLSLGASGSDVSRLWPDPRA